MKTKGAQKQGTSVKALKPTTTRKRITFRFQLDIARDNVEFFSQLQKWLTAQRSWKRYAMDGLRLLYDLKSGSTAVLLELFPNIREMLAVGQGDDGLKSEIAELKRLILEQGAIAIPKSDNGYTMASQPVHAPTGNLKALKAISMPVFDDDEETQEFTVVKAKVDGMQIARNLVGSAMGLSH